MHDMMDFEAAARLLEKGIIEVAPLALCAAARSTILL